jgi:hypothetical protein
MEIGIFIMINFLLANGWEKIFKVSYTFASIIMIYILDSWTLQIDICCSILKHDKLLSLIQLIFSILYKSVIGMTRKQKCV